MKLILFITVAISSQSSASQALLADPYDRNLLGWSVWSEWSDCSKSCGGGQQRRVRRCEGGDTCGETFDFESVECNEWKCSVGEWGQWSPCEDGWHFREKLDDEGVFEEEECGLDDSETQQWTKWGECDQEVGRRSRDRCTSEFGCEVQQQECGQYEAAGNLGGIGEVPGGAWGPCVQGMRTRLKCREVDMCEEEIVVCTSNYWSEWGECKEGKQERTKCEWGHGCESELRPCGGPLVLGHWSEWSSCIKGFHSRQKCDAEGLDCQFEDKECEYDASSEVWSDWSECRDGFKERTKCDGNGECKVLAKECDGPAFTRWSLWGKCNADGTQERDMCDVGGCIFEVRGCYFDSSIIGEDDEEVQVQEYGGFNSLDIGRESPSQAVEENFIFQAGFAVQGWEAIY